MPIPSPTPEQIEIVFEIIRTETLDKTAVLVDGLSDGLWARTIEDIEKWEGGIKDDFTKIVGKVVIDPNDPRLALINRVRGRLGLPDLIINSSGQYTATSISGIGNLSSTLKWFDSCR